MKTRQGFRQKLEKEIRTVALTTLYFAAWFGVLAVLKRLILADHQIEFRGLSLALVGALIVAKVVLVLEYVPLGRWTRKRAALLDVAVRTLLYAAGVAIVLLLERAFEARHEAGGFVSALAKVFQHRDIYLVWANTICVASALFVFNALSVVRHHLGDGQLIPLFLAPLPEESNASRRVSIP
jgi:hypothetical protein